MLRAHECRGCVFVCVCVCVCAKVGAFGAFDEFFPRDGKKGGRGGVERQGGARWPALRLALDKLVSMEAHTFRPTYMIKT